ncbi:MULTISPECIES: hypothetical protein [Clostridium]|jgi:hypothetical protein|uniref:hypothetical protein n=1 Tax=Clostridium TaxID=1485 RepID=UPI00242CB243|nr:hypothetical protein [Clostridium tyrobutyricum]
MSTITYSFKCSTDDLEDRPLIEALSKHKKNKTAFIKECISQYIKTDNSRILDEISFIKEQLNNINKALENYQLDAKVIATDKTSISPTISPITSEPELLTKQENEGKKVLEIADIPVANTNAEQDNTIDMIEGDEANDNAPDDEMIKNINECMSQFTNI